MENIPSNIIDLRPKIILKRPKHRVRCFKKKLFWIIPLMVLLVALSGLNLFKIGQIEKQYPNILNLLPEIGDNLNTFNWDQALSKINSLDVSLPVSQSLNRGIENILEHIPFLNRKIGVSLYYDLKHLGITLNELNTNNVFKLKDSTQSSWSNLYPQLLKEIEGIALTTESLRIDSLSTQWQGLFIKLSNIDNLFGSAQPINYLLVLNDVNQVRPLGGEIAGVIAVTISNWQIDYWQAYNANSLDNQISSKIIPPKELQLISTNWTLRQSNWFGDLNLFAQSLTNLWKKSLAGSLFQPDALILFNIQDLEPLDGYLGNISLGSQTINNLRDYLGDNLKSYRLSSGPLAEDYLSFVNDYLPQNIETLKGKEWLSILRAYTEKASTDNLSYLYFLPWRQANLADKFNVKEIPNTFLFTHSDLNLPVPDLSSNNLKTSAQLTIKKNADGYNLDWIINITNQNSKSFTDFIRFYLPTEATVVTVSGLDKYLIPDDPINYTVKKFSADPLILESEEQKNCPDKTNYCLSKEGTKSLVAGWSKIKSGQTKTLKIQITLPLSTEEIMISPPIGKNLSLLLKGDGILSSDKTLIYLNKSASLGKNLLIQLNHD
jgi:hypothetical protein